jgi:hypothetical protein
LTRPSTETRRRRRPKHLAKITFYVRPSYPKFYAAITKSAKVKDISEAERQLAKQFIRNAVADIAQYEYDGEVWDFRRQAFVPCPETLEYDHLDRISINGSRDAKNIFKRIVTLNDKQVEAFKQGLAFRKAVQAFLNKDKQFPRIDSVEGRVKSLGDWFTATVNDSVWRSSAMERLKELDLS